MAQIFQINGTTLTYPTKANWIQDINSLGFDGNSSLKRWVSHSLRAEVMTETEYNTLDALSGQKVSLTTTDYDDRNSDYKTYYGVDFEEVSGNHNGPVFENVLMSFLIRL